MGVSDAAAGLAEAPNCLVLFTASLSEGSASRAEGPNCLVLSTASLSGGPASLSEAPASRRDDAANLAKGAVNRRKTAGNFVLRAAKFRDDAVRLVDDAAGGDQKPGSVCESRWFIQEPTHRGEGGKTKRPALARWRGGAFVESFVRAA